MKVVFSTEALQEVQEAQRYYEDEVEGLGKAFVETLHAAIQKMKRAPEISRIIKKPYRRYLIQRFPYGIIYRVEDDTIYVVAIAHLKRRPYYWKNR
ncbi:MAG: type II toxin-antitoxin system RelE/ParE family toxin [Bacteroidota bacterium]